MVREGAEELRVQSGCGRGCGYIAMGCELMRQFAGKGRMVICAETRLYYVTLGAEGARITDYDYTDIL
jgi:hypothetical protein